MSWARRGVSPLALAAVALLPKCPLCLAGYLSFVTLLGLSAKGAAGVLLLALAALGVLGTTRLICQLYRRGRKLWCLFLLAGLGMVLVVRLASWPGPFLVVAGICLSAVWLVAAKKPPKNPAPVKSEIPN